MKEVTLKEFLTLPAGTLFTEWGWLSIKGETIRDKDGNAIDFFEEIITPLQDDDEDYGMGLGRWGEFDDKAIFLVYEDSDRQTLIDKLKK